MSFRFSGRSFVSMLVNPATVRTVAGSELVSGAEVVVTLGTTPVAIANTETRIIALSIPANTIRAGDYISFFTSAGRAGANAAAPTFRLRVGPTTLTGAEVFSNTTLATTNPGGSVWQGIANFHTIGAAGKSNSGGLSSINSSVTSTVHNCGRTTDAAIDTTVTNLVELTFISGNAANTYTFNAARLAYGRSSQ